jgi:hypothetical protein
VLLEDGVNVDSKDNSDRTLLSYAAAKNGHVPDCYQAIVLDKGTSGYLKDKH